MIIFKQLSIKDIRFAAWSAILSGAAGHIYGGVHVWLVLNGGIWHLILDS
jgi:hypothetical protein